MNADERRWVPFPFLSSSLSLSLSLRSLSSLWSFRSLTILCLAFLAGCPRRPIQAGETDLSKARAANTVLAGPSSGADAGPSFRALTATDIPALAPAKITLAATNQLLGRGTAGAGTGEEMTLSSDNGVAFTYAANALKIDTPQDLRTTASPTFVTVNGSNFLASGSVSAGYMTYYSGSATPPASPVTGSRWHQNATNILWMYDGTQWVSDQVYVLNSFGYFSMTVNATGSYINDIATQVLPNLYDWYVLALTIGGFTYSAHDAANHYLIQIRARTGASGIINLGAPIDTNGAGAATTFWFQKTVPVNSVLTIIASNIPIIDSVWTKYLAAPDIYLPHFTISFRLKYTAP